MATGPIQMHIAEVLTAVPAQAGVDAGMVVLTENDAPSRSLRIIIGQPEANAIYAGWHGNIPGRPSTWDLYVSSVALLGARIDRAVVTAVHEERHYFAHLELEQAGERHVVACRPSDALAIAVRSYDVGIWAEESVLDAAGVLPDGTRPGDTSTDDPDFQSREAALAAREAELAERERQLAARELIASAPLLPLPELPTDAPAPEEDQIAGSEQAPEEPAKAAQQYDRGEPAPTNPTEAVQPPGGTGAAELPNGPDPSQAAQPPVGPGPSTGEPSPAER